MLPWIGAFIAMILAGYWLDHLSKAKDLTTARRIPIITSFVGTAVFMALAAFTLNQWVALVYITLSVTFLGINFSM